MITPAQEAIRQRFGRPVRCADCHADASHVCERCREPLCDAHEATHASNRSRFARCYWSRSDDRHHNGRTRTAAGARQLAGEAIRGAAAMLRPMEAAKLALMVLAFLLFSDSRAGGGPWPF